MAAASGSRYTRRIALRAGLIAATSVAFGARTPHAWADVPSLLVASAPAMRASDGYDADIGLDPGHSRADVGASGGGVGEFEHTLEVALRIVPVLEAAGLRVALTRTGHEPLTTMAHPNVTERTRIEQRARIEAVGNARIYVSVHFNGGPAALRGTETYYNRENAGGEGRRLAEALQRHIVAALASVGHPVIDRGARDDLTIGKPYGHLFSLRGSMPSALGEALFLSNPTEAALLLREDARDALARGYAGGILEYFADARSPETP